MERDDEVRWLAGERVMNGNYAVPGFFIVWYALVLAWLHAKRAVTRALSSHLANRRCRLERRRPEQALPPPLLRLRARPLDQDAGIALVGLTRARFEGLRDLVRDLDDRALREDADRADLVARDATAAADVREQPRRRRPDPLAPAHHERRTLFPLRRSSDLDRKSVV